MMNETFSRPPAPFLTLLIATLATGCTGSTRAQPPLPGPETLASRQVRVVYHIGADKWREGVGEGLFFAERLVETYEREGIVGDDRQFVIVLYDSAAYWLLNEDAWARYPGPKLTAATSNPNAALLKKLVALGVHVEICGMTMQRKGWSPHDLLLPEISVVPGARARVIDLQLAGFASMGFD